MSSMIFIRNGLLSLLLLANISAHAMQGNTAQLRHSLKNAKDSAWFLSLLTDICGNNNSNLQQQTIDYIKNNPSFAKQELEKIFTAHNGSLHRTFLQRLTTASSDLEKLLYLVRNNEACSELIAHVITTHFESFIQLPQFKTFLTAMFENGHKQDTFKTFIIPNISKLLATESKGKLDHLIAFRISYEFIPDKVYGPQIIKTLAHSKQTIDIDYLTRAFISHTHDFIKYFCVDNKYQFTKEDEDSLIQHMPFSVGIREYDAKHKPTGRNDWVFDFITDNFEKIIQTSLGISYLRKIDPIGSWHPQGFTEQCRTKYKDNLSIFCESQEGILFTLDMLRKNDSELLAATVPYISKFIDTYITHNDFYGLYSLVNHSILKKEAQEKLIQAIDADPTKLSAARVLCTQYSCDKNLKGFIERQMRNNPNSLTIPSTIYYYNKHYISDKINFRTLSPTQAHLANFGIAWEGIDYYTKNDLTTLAAQLIAKEKELNTQKYYTFIHGQRWKYQLPEEWFTQLWGMVNNKNVKNFLFGHIKPLSCDLKKMKEDGLLRSRILQQGRTGKLWDGGEDRSLMLFMNAGLFYNETDKGSNSAYYIAQNDNVNNHINLSLEKVFKDLELEHIYTKYSKELTALEEEHATLSNFGNTLLIAIPQNKIKNMVFVAAPGGFKKKVIIDGIGETDDIKHIMETLRTDPSKIHNFDRNEFVLMMTQDKDGGLNPDSGIKIHQFNAVEPEKWNAFKYKEKVLFNKIKAEITSEKFNEFYTRVLKLQS